MHSLSKKIKEEASHLGIDLIGFTQAIPHPDLNIFKDWLTKDHQASMKWLDRSIEKRSNPNLILPDVKSIISCGLIYYRGHPLSIDSKNKDHGWISNYAWGEDYHEVFLEKLKTLEIFIKKNNPHIKTKAYVDTGPILERSYAASAGLGWIGKNTCLINPKQGSFFFIGEILIDIELDYDASTPNHCGKCTRCLDACPTDALTEYELNSNKCIAYLTIEHRGDIDKNLQNKMGHHLIGCDICQDVCPWNSKAKPSQHKEFDPREDFFNPNLDALENLTQMEFSTKYKKSPVKRVKLDGLLRNVKIAQKNQN